MNIPLTIHVTKTDIVGATRCNPCHCPIARAIRRQLRNPFRRVFSYVRLVDGKRFDFERPYNTETANDIVVGGEGITLPFLINIDLPEIASNFISRYDDKQTVKPFAFTINVPDYIAMLFSQPLALPASPYSILPLALPSAYPQSRPPRNA